jgi:3-oxoadipate enol-lactonase
MPFVTASDGARIHYRTAGDHGPFVVLIQGLTLSGRFWFDLPERVATDGYRTVWLDNRGTGQSDEATRTLSMRVFADDVITLMDHVGARTATVVGISMGGMIAQHLGLLYPERVEGLVLMATSCGLPHGTLAKLSTLAALFELPFPTRHAASRRAQRAASPREEGPSSLCRALRALA